MIEDDRTRYAGYEGMGNTSKDMDIETWETSIITPSSTLREHI